MPPEIAKLMSSSRLIAFPKSNGDVRSIAVGDALRRLTARAICVQKKERFADYVTPIQHGVSTQNGTDLVAHQIGLMLEVDQYWIVLKSDVRNAFNSISRCDMLNEVSKASPDLFSHIQQMYGYSSFLIYLQGSSSIVIPSQEEVHQSDPLRRVLFATTTHPILSEIQNNIPEATSIANLNDVFLPDSPGKVLAAFNMVKKSFSTINLSVSETKCEVFSPNVIYLTGFDGIPVSHNGLIFLGIPVGTFSFVSTTCVKAAHSGDQLCQQLEKLEDQQSSMLLLRHCHIPRLIIWLDLWSLPCYVNLRPSKIFNLEKRFFVFLVKH